MKEWPAAASVVQATREHKECFWGHGAATFQNVQKGALSLLQAITHCFPGVAYPQSIEHNAPETLVIIKATGVGNQPPEHVSMSSLCSAEASLTGELEVTGGQTECTFPLILHVLTLLMLCLVMASYC